MALYRKKKQKRFSRTRHRYTSDYRRRRSSVIRKIVLGVLICAALFALGFFVIEPWIERTFAKPDPTDTASVNETAPPETPTPVPTPEPTPEPTPTPTPASTVRLLTVDELTDPEQFAAALNDAKESGADTVLLPLKTDDGRLTYRTENETARSIGAPLENAVDLAETVAAVREAGLAPAGLFTVFDEPFTADKLRSTAIKYDHTETRWLAPGDRFLQDPGLEATQEYELALIGELAAHDLSFVTLKGCHYPVWGSLYGCTPDETKSREENITAFLAAAKELLTPSGTKLDLLLPADVAVGDFHDRFPLYGYPEDLSALPCDSLSLDLRLDRVLNENYPAITVDGVSYSDLSADEDTSLCVLYGAAFARAQGIGAFGVKGEAAASFMEWGALRVTVFP